MRYAGMVLVAALLVGGCAALKQAKTDYDVGKSAPIADGELSPRAAADALIEPIKPFLPTPLQPLAGVAVTVLAAIGAWRRGRRIRLNQPASSNPITGSWGARIGLETLVQHVGTAAQGLYEVGPENSGLRRIWKVLVSAVLVILALPPVQTFALAHPGEVGGLMSALAVVAGLEKELSRVLPVKPPEPPTTSA